MKLADLDLRDLFDASPTGGVMRFAGERALIFDAVALGLVRRTLIETLGMNGARGILTQFGYAHGHRTAMTLKHAFPWDTEQEWRIAGARLHQLQGLVRPERVAGSNEFVEDVWRDSYEAEQHLMHVGRADAPVCWSLVGFATGYLTYANGREIYAVETQCRAMGDAVCHVVARPRAEWGNALAAHLPFYAKASLDEALAHATEELKRTERRLRARKQQLATFRAEREEQGLTARSPAMRKLLELAERVARVDSTIIISGESGVGKERVARFIHERSERAKRTMVAVNCGALPDTLLESELFGNVKGAFTGATQDRPGLFEAASGGTLFLDEIGEVSPAMQVKLLRALQEHEVRRVGENTTRKVDVRVITATNRNLAEEVRAGRFREDLYYRLRVIELEVPPLRERREDIVPLARALLAAVAPRAGSRVTGFTPRAVEHLVRYRWPGNVRELENAIERAVVLAAGARIDVGDLPGEVTSSGATAWVAGDARTLADVEKDTILAVLAAENGNRARAAARLGIAPATLYRKLAAYRAAPTT